MIEKTAASISATVDSASQDAHLACVLEKYLADLEAGTAPGAQQLLDENPDIRDRLADCLAGL